LQATDRRTAGCPQGDQPNPRSISAGRASIRSSIIGQRGCAKAEMAYIMANPGGRGQPTTPVAMYGLSSAGFKRNIGQIIIRLRPRGPRNPWRERGPATGKSNWVHVPDVLGRSGLYPGPICKSRERYRALLGVPAFGAKGERLVGCARGRAFQALGYFPRTGRESNS